jgi:ubiquinone/menaquinone biosynthesis C-methylase UbiE
MITEHYGRGDLSSAILAALEAAGKDIDRLTPEDLAPFDEFHVRGREATAELGEGLGLRSGMHVLDVGSGIGGPSRHLAHAHGCRVTGVDLTEEYCRVATMLAARAGLARQVSYREGNAVAMPFEDGVFDAAYTQHAAMNIADKPALYAEVARVLRPGARFGIYDLLQGEGGEVLYPVPWARTETASFMITPTELRPLLEAVGFEILSWRDTTAEGRAWFKEMGARIERYGPPRLGFHLLLGSESFMEMARNQVRNLAEDRIAATEVICRKT